MESETYLERQEDEVEFLQCVFMNDFEDLRNKDPWKIKRPPEIELFLTPQKSMGASIKQRIQISVKLHAKYTTDYPDTPPELHLVNPHCLSEDLVKILLKEIQHLASEKLGEVMMLEIVQHVQEFLHKHDLPPVSLHEEMIKRRKREAEEERQRLQQERLRLEEEQMRLEQELLQRKSGNSLGDSSGSEEDTGSIDQSDIRMESPQKEFNERKKVNIIRGKLLGISSCGGYSVYSGMDCEQGDIIIIYKWIIPCKTATTRTKRMKQIASIRQEFEHFLEKDFIHSNLVQYIEMRHEINDTNIIVEVVCECIKGGNLSEILRNPNTGCLTGQILQLYCRQLLVALDYLHTRGIVHNDLRPSLIFVDSVKGIIKLCGYTIIKRLSDLVNPISRNDGPHHYDQSTRPVSWPPGLIDTRGGKKQDMLKLGMIVLCMLTDNPNISYPPQLPSHLPEQTQDFLNKCLDDNEYKRYLSHDLMTHPFVTPSPLLNTFVKLNINDDLPGLPQQSHVSNSYDSSVFQSSESIVGSPGDSRVFCNMRSRLGTDFDEMETLGSGGFGDVIKVKNRLDGRFYAIKKIKLAGGTKMMNKLTREVELLSQMNHENIVRYYNAWIESFPDPNYTTDMDYNMDGSDSASSSDSASFDEDESDDDDIEDSLMIDFQSETDSNSKTEPGSDIEEEVFEFSAGFSSNDFSNEHLMIGTQQMEANVMDISPRRFRRSETESSDGIVFQESSSTPTLYPSIINEDDEEQGKEQHRKRRGPGQIQYLYIQMEYCSNQTVRQLIDSGQLYRSHRQLEWQLFREIVEGLAHIHAQGMIHRDLKPGNIFLNSSGHIKIGDFGLAISFNKHPALSRQNSISTIPSAVLAGDTGLVGTALYLAPELVTNHILKYSPKVDIYSLGIIFFEMCHPPVSTLMERSKLLTDIRKKEIKFPDMFEHNRMNRNTLVIIKWLLNHNPQERPTSKELLQSPLVPYKIVDEELQEVFTRTLQNPNSSRYRRLIDELFSQQNPKLMELNFFIDPKIQDSKKGLDKIKLSHSHTYGLLRDHIRSTVANVFTKHCALNIHTLLFGPSYQTLDTSVTTKLMDNSGKILSLPDNHWISFARHIYHQNITSLKRYDFSKIYTLPKRSGAHPKEIDEYAFDIATSSSKLLPSAEVVTVVLEILSALSLIQQRVQFTLWLNHTSLAIAILNYCSITSDHHYTVLQYLHQISVTRTCPQNYYTHVFSVFHLYKETRAGDLNGENNQMKLVDLEKTLRDKHNIQLSILATKTLLKLMDSEIPLTEVDSTLQLLIRCRSSVSTLAKQALQDIRQLLKQLGVVQVKVCIHPGMILNPEFFDGVTFQFVQHDLSQTKKKKKHSTPMAVGGQYDKLVDNFRKINKLTREPFGGGRDTNSTYSSPVIVFGVSIREEILLTAVANQFITNQSTFQISNCHALICWLGKENLHTERNELIKDLRERGLCVDILYETMMTLEDIQEYCRRRYIPCLVLLERSYWIKQQVTVRTLESGRATEKVIGKNELFEYLQTKHGIDKSSDSTDIITTSNVGSKSSTTSGSDVSSTAGGSLPSIAITTLGRQKLQGNMRRRMDSQTLSKLIPLLQTYSPKHSVEIIVVDFELEPLCLFAAEVNKALGRGRTDLSNVIRILNESDNLLGKKYVAKVCESIQEKITEKSSVIILYSHVIERYQIIVNNSILITNNNS